MAEENSLLSEVSRRSGLPVKSLASDNPLIQEAQQRSGKLITPDSRRHYEFSGLEASAGQINLTNTYTDPLESYTSYGVPRNAFEDWNEIRAENQTTVEKWARGLTKAGITALGAVAENTIGVAGGLLNLAFGENHSYYDNPVGRSIDEINQWAQEAMPNYYTKREQEMGVLEGLGTANFWADKFANGAGYTLGSLATAWLGVGEGAMLAKAANVGRMSKIAKAADKAMDVTQDAAKFGSKQFQLYNAAKVVNSQTGKTIAKGIDQGLAKMAKQAGIKTAAKNLSVGLHMSLAEASVEAREVKNKFIEEQTAKWEEANPGQEMPADVEDAIIASASAAGNVTFGVNLPLLVTTNAISFGKMFMGIKPTAESKLFDIKKVKDKWVEAIPEKGMAKAFAKANRILGAPIKNSISEGAQEAGQFITAEAAGDYYSDKFADGTGDMVEAFTNGLSKSIGTKEGLESILIGALVGGGSGTLSTLFGADKKFNKAKTANTQKALEILNSEGFGKVLENMEQSQRNIALVKEMGEATTAGEFKKAELARRKLISSVANQYRKAGALDFAMEQMDDLKQLDEEEFKKRWGYDASKTLKEQTGMEQGEIIDDVKSKMERSVKRQEQVQDILRAQQPSTGLFARILNSFESEELRNSKVVESSIRNMYGNVLLNRLEDVDANDDLIKEAYKELREMAPALSQIPEEDFEFMVKTGAVKINDKGEVEVSDTITNAPNKKLADKLNEVFLAKNILNPEDAKQFANKARELGSLVAVRESAIQSYNGLRDKPEDIALLVEAEVEKRKLDDRYKNKQEAQAAIANSESVDELDKAFPKNADSEDIAAAMAKREELLAKEDAIVATYKKMSKEEFDAIDAENLSPLEESAYKRYKKIRDEEEAANNHKKDIGVSVPTENELAAQAADQVLSDIEARTFGEVMVNPDGNTVTINGRVYSNLEDNPFDAIIRNEQGVRIGFAMTDMATGNKITWKITDPADSSNTELAEKETSIAESLAYLTLLKGVSIRPDQSVPLSEAEEQLEPRIRAIEEDAEARDKFEENSESTETERQIAESNLTKTVGLTDDQIRAQIETLKSDLEEINQMLDKKEQYGREKKQDKKTVDSDPEVKKLRSFKKRHTKLLEFKIKTLRERKQAKRQEALDTKNTEAEVEAVLSPSEEDLIKTGLAEEIKALEDEIVPLDKDAQVYKDMISGKYGENQDVAAATVELKNINKKIGVIKAKITKRRNLINKLNNERESEELRQDRDSAEGAGIAPEGQESEGKDITPGEGTQAEGLDGILDEAEVEKLRQQREEAERLRKQQEQNKKAQEPTPQPINISPAPITISSPGALDVRLAKGEKQVLNGKVLVADIGTSLPSDTVEQTSNNEAIKVNHSLSSNPAVAPTGTQVRFEVREDTDWWISQSPNIPADEHWKTVPIYMVVKDAEGVEQKIALLQSATEDSGQMRRDIYNLYKQGLTPVATSAGKIFNSSNYSNARLADGTAFFYPSASLMQAGQTPAIAIVGVKDTVKTFKVATQGTATFPNLEDTVEASDASNLALGQVAIVSMDPNGKPILVMASTRSMTESGRTAALAQITGEVPSLGSFAQIVGTNLLLNDSVDPSQNENVYTEINDEMQQEYSTDAKNFMLVETLADGTELITFFSPSANSLVRMNAQNMKLALAGAKPMFSFIEVGTNEKGFKSLVTAKKDDSVRSVVEMKLADEFKAAIMNKKFQVDKTLLNNTESYTSPITGEVYPSYFQYLNSEKEVAEDRTEGKGTKAILGVDTEVNSQKSPFFDVGIKTTNLGTLENDVIAAQDLAAKQVMAPTDNSPTSYPITETPAAPVFNQSLKEELTPYSVDYIKNLILGAAVSKSDIFGIERVIINLAGGGRKSSRILGYIGTIDKSGYVTKENLLTAVYDIYGEKIGDGINLLLESEERQMGETFEDRLVKEINSKYQTTTPAAPVSDIEAKKADIERRREEEHKKYKYDRTKPNPVDQKYDAELAALGQPVTPAVTQLTLLTTNVKKGIFELFESYPELAFIGTPEQYSQYLDSKGYNNIYYHYTTASKKFDKFDKDKIGTTNLRNTSGVDTVSIVDNLKLAQAFGQFGLDVYSMSKEDITNFDDSYAKTHNSNIIFVGINNKEVNKKNVFKTPLANGFEINVENLEALDILGSKKDIEGFKKFITPAVTQPAPSNEIVTVYHHTSVTPENFNFSSFQRGKEQISQFGDGLNAASTTTPFFVKRYGNPIKGEVRDSEFVVIDANMSQKAMYEMLASKGFKFNNPQMGKATPEGAKYVGGSAAAEYDDTDPLRDSAGAAMDLFKDFQESNPQVKGVKVINHKIGNEKVDPFYVIYDAKSFYGPGSLSKSNAPTTTQPAPSVPSEEKVMEITGAEDTGGIFDLIPEAKPAAPKAPEDATKPKGLSFISAAEARDMGFDDADPTASIPDLAAEAAKYKAQAENTQTDC